MKGYSPVELDRREADGLPYATGADEPRHDWHDQPFEGASDVGLQPLEQAETDLLHMSAAS